MEKIIKREKINDFVNNLLNDFKVFAPVLDDSVVLFRNIIDTKNIYLDFKNSIKPPNEFLFPQNEILFEFSKSKEKIELQDVELKENIIIFGIHPCDVKSILMFDNVFKKDYLDNYYIKRRENTVLISFGCTEPENTCFCTSFGIDPTNTNSTDILFFSLGDEYYLRAYTETGKNIINKSSEFFEDIKEEKIKLLQKRKKEIIEKMKNNIEIKGIENKLKNLFEDKLWYKISLRCLSCGICSFCCPTCHCFDIQDEEFKNCGYRFRCWDTCQFKEFTQEASGHNPRPTKKERQRQRYQDKFNYFFERYSDYACVGCGRCVRLCPVNIDIREIIKYICGYS